jgi:hypothetical protein
MPSEGVEEKEDEEHEAEQEEEDEEEKGEEEDSDEDDDEEERPTFGVPSGRLVSQLLLVLIGVILGLALSQPERFSVAFIARGAAVDEMLPPSPPRTVPFDEDDEDEEAGGYEDEDDEMHADWMREQGWERHVDPTSGKPFYHHAPSQVSQWERPTTSPASPVEAGEDELPSGWSSATDPDTGQPYYWSDSSRETTTWVHPRKRLKAGWEEHCSMAKVSWLVATQVAATRRHPEAHPLAQGYPLGPRGERSPIPLRLTTRHWDADAKRYFYHESGTTRSSWEPPS